MADSRHRTPISKDRSANAVANAIFVQLSDGSATLSAAEGGAMPAQGIAPLLDTGTGTPSLFFQGNSAGDLKVTLDGEALSISLAASYADDSAFTVASDEVLALGALADETTPDSVDEGDIGVLRMSLDRRLLIALRDSGGDELAITASGSAAVDIAEQSLTALAVSKDNSANSETNPLWVKLSEAVGSGEEVVDYDDTVVNSDSSGDHDYSIAGTNGYLTQVVVSASGYAKFDIKRGDLVGGPTTVATLILDDGGGSAVWEPKTPLEQSSASNGGFRVTRNNLEDDNISMYSTMMITDV